MFQTKPNWRDVTVCFAVALVAVLFALRLWIGTNRGSFLSVVTTEGETKYSLSVDRIETIQTNGHTLLLQIRDGRACIVEADCPDQICVRSGWIEKAGETVVCAPAGVRLTVTEGGGDGVDLVVG